MINLFEIKMLTKGIYITTASAFLSFVWEYTAKRYASTIKPSVALTYLANGCYDVCYGMGTYAAKLSSFLTWLDFNEIIATGHDLVKPIINIFVSPYYFLTVYINTSLLYEHPYLVAMGSITVLLLLLFIYYTWFMSDVNRQWLLINYKMIMGVEHGRTSNTMLGETSNSIIN